MVVYKVLRLYTTSEKFYIQPLVEVSENPKILEIDRLTQELFLNENKGQIPPRSAEVSEIYGILGIIHLLAGPYLVVVTKRKLIGLLNGEEIWQMKQAELVSFPKGTMHLTENQIRENKILLQMVTSTLQTDGFYYSYTHDLTHSVQRLHNTSRDFKESPLYERADHRFIWNHGMLSLFVVQPELSAFVLPLMHGFVSIKKCNIKQFLFEFVLISRRSCYRAGTRYNVRGLDESGEVANFVETEQLFLYNGEVASFVQLHLSFGELNDDKETFIRKHKRRSNPWKIDVKCIETRGSIPMYWSQFPNIKYKPKPILTPDHNHMEGFKRHIDSQLVYYGKQTIINLIDKKGSEKILGDNLKNACQQSGYNDIQLQYIDFDFHKECSKMRWHRLQILLDQLQHHIQAMSCFYSKHNEVLTQQSGSFRTNCMDCLDRTNVVQSLIARIVLEKQLREAGVIGSENKIIDFAEFEFTFKNVWADNADMCARQYTGTGALKTDFTRTGKRTKYGLLQDGVNSMVRYYKNNFSDGFRQDGIDLLLGNYTVYSNDVLFSLEQQRSWKYVTLPTILLVGFSMLIICLLIPATTFRLQLTYVIFWATACLLTLYFVSLYGREFVDVPRLTHRRSKEAKI